MTSNCCGACSAQDAPAHLHGGAGESVLLDHALGAVDDVDEEPARGADAEERALSPGRHLAPVGRCRARTYRRPPLRIREAPGTGSAASASRNGSAPAGRGSLSGWPASMPSSKTSRRLSDPRSSSTPVSTPSRTSRLPRPSPRISARRPESAAAMASRDRRRRTKAPTVRPSRTPGSALGATPRSPSPCSAREPECGRSDPSKLSRRAEIGN